ncbi:hypothetical protein NRB_37740 [Novosphingobium sp. 11B]
MRKVRRPRSVRGILLAEPSAEGCSVLTMTQLERTVAHGKLSKLKIDSTINMQIANKKREWE